MRKRNLSVFLALAVMFMSLAAPLCADAATINVTASATDTLNGSDGQCSLREAITNINNGASTYADCLHSGAYGTSDTINIPAGTYTTVITTYTISKNVSIVGASAGTTIIDGNALGRVFYIADGPYAVSISGVTIQHGSAANYGGGIAIWSGTLTVANSTITSNTAGIEGGAIYNWFATLTVTKSTISSNTANGGWGGGGIFNVGPLTVTNSTITGNTAANYGGGIFQGGSGGTLIVINSTISGNTAAAGGGIHTNGDTATLSNSIVANQTAGADCSGSIISAGHNLESGTSCGFTGTGDLRSTNPLLSALANNGGPTQTVALQLGSPAIDGGDNAICAAAPVNGVDQRSYTRPAGAKCDIGAFEYGALNTTPNAFSFTAQTGMPLSTSIVSNPITVTGIDSATAISITGGEYSVSTNGGTTWTAYSSTTPVTVSLNNQVMVSRLSSSSLSTMTTATLNIGGMTADFNVTTAALGDPNASGLIAWWKAEDNAYDSVGGNNGTPMNGATYGTGRVGQAFSFDGVNDYVEMPNSDSLNFGANQPMSINMWVKRTSTSGSQIIFAKRPGCGAQVHYQLQWYEPNNWMTFCSTNGFDNGVTTTVDKLPLNTWTFISITYDGAMATMYINGNPVASHAMSFDPVSVPLRLGGEPSCGGQLFGGLIDEVKIFNRALSAAEVAKLSDQVPDAFSFTAKTGVALNTVVESGPITVTGISYPTAISITGGQYEINGSGTWTAAPVYVSAGDHVKARLTSSGNYDTTKTASITIGGVNALFSVTTMPSASDIPGLIAYYPFNGNAADASGNGHDATVYGATLTTDRFGNSANAYAFNGNGQYIDSGLALSAYSTVTVSLWVKLNGSTGGPNTGIVSNHRATVDSNDFWLSVPQNTSTVYISGFNQSATLYRNGQIVPGGSFEISTGWEHVAFTVTVNGTFGGYPVLFGLHELGAPGWSNPYFNGLIDDVRIYDHALSALEIATLAGTKPDAFTFAAKIGAALNTSIESNAITVIGISYPSAISITGGEYSVSSNGGSTWSDYSASTPSKVSLNDQVKVRQTSSPSYSTTTTATLTIGGVIGMFSVTTMPIPVYTLTVTKIGSGIVTAIPEGGSDTLIWTGNTGTASYNEGTHLSLTAAAGTGYTFYEWTGDYVSYENPLQITMDSNRAITATFDDYTGTSCINPPFKIGLGTHNYPTIKDAYDGLGNNELLMIRAVSFTESLLNLNQGKAVGLSGGYSCDFTTNAGFTTIHGTLTISEGIVAIENLIVQ